MIHHVRTEEAAGGFRSAQGEHPAPPHPSAGALPRATRGARARIGRDHPLTAEHGRTTPDTTTTGPRPCSRWSRAVLAGWRVKDSNLGRHQPTDLQSAPICIFAGHIAVYERGLTDPPRYPAQSATLRHRGRTAHSADTNARPNAAKLRDKVDLHVRHLCWSIACKSILLRS
jgi:hypothetical protein